MPQLAMAFLTVGLVFCGLFAALGGFVLTQLATPALGAARMLGAVALLVGLVAVRFTQTQPGSGFYLVIASLPLVFWRPGVSRRAEDGSGEQRQLESAGKERSR